MGECYTYEDFVGTIPAEFVDQGPAAAAATLNGFEFQQILLELPAEAKALADITEFINGFADKHTTRQDLGGFGTDIHKTETTLQPICDGLYRWQIQTQFVQLGEFDELEENKRWTFSIDNVVSSGPAKAPRYYFLTTGLKTWLQAKPTGKRADALKRCIEF